MGGSVNIDNIHPADLVFFKNNDNKINHVGIALENHQIIHASGKVRVDNLSKDGILLSKNKQLTHRLHSIKRIIE
jgi:cell wall-associated NlpC family hydrolase